MDQEPVDAVSRPPADREVVAAAPETGEARWDAGATGPRGWRRWRLYVWLAVLALLIAGAAWSLKWTSDWSKTGVLEPSGGLYFAKRVELPVPLFRQGDPQWRHDLLGPTQDTVGATGCAITSVAM